MKTKIKKLIPKTIKDLLRPLKKKLIDNPKKRALFLKMQKKHQQLIEQIKCKEKIKVVFLAIHKSVWKVDPVFKKMLDVPYFEPIILVCPYTFYGEERMWEDMKDTYEYFKDKGYPLLSSYNKDEDRWISLEEIKPDIVFFTNPHNLTRKEYYEDAYMNYLSCYAGYGMSVANFENGEAQYNQRFHNAIWIIFVQNRYMYNDFIKSSSRTTKGLFLVIDNIAEEIISMPDNQKIVWKNFDTHKKIIFAPHHTINKDFSLQLGNFLKYAELLKLLVLETEKSIVWAFKPHPILKSKLYLHKDWGAEKTDAYYSFWENQPNSQLDVGEYVDLFRQSDAMIHDSASFIAEYIFTDKPMLYLMNDNTRKNLNYFGNRCLDTAKEAWNEKNIRNFIDDLLSDKDYKKNNRNLFIDEYFNNLGANKSSSVIVEIIKNYIKPFYKG